MGKCAIGSVEKKKRKRGQSIWETAVNTGKEENGQKKGLNIWKILIGMIYYNQCCGDKSITQK
jgi:hypothetical protein